MKLTANREIEISSVKKLCYYLEDNLPDRKTIGIFLTVENTDYPNVRLLDNVLKIEVADTEVQERDDSFKVSDGMLVKKYLEREADFGKLYVCCDSGESRSTAMAAAIMRYFGVSDKEIWTNPMYHPNLLVYKNQLEAFGIKISKFKLKYLRYLSNKAFKTATKKGLRK